MCGIQNYAGTCSEHYLRSTECRVQPRQGIASHKLLSRAPCPVSAAAVSRDTTTDRDSTEWETCSGPGQPSRRILVSPPECKGRNQRAGKLGWERMGRGKAPSEMQVQEDTMGG